MYSVLATLMLTTGGVTTAYCGTFALKLFRTYDISEVTQEWLEGFSVAKYAPMETLLAADDFEFLSRQPGFDLSLYRKLRRERLHIFRQYLNCLIADFGKLHAAILSVLPYSDVDHSELLSKLIRLKFSFAFYVLAVEGSYFMCLLGLRTISVRSLISSLDQMNAHHLQVSAARSF